MVTVDLTVGLDTFAPITTTNPIDHKIHTESYSVSVDTLERCRQARRVVAVGTTATRALETAASTGLIHGRSSLFITPGYDWKLVDLLITNFHMPESTLLMMVSAFGGYDLIMKAYKEAIKEKYRFYSYGDVMLII